MQPRPRWGRRKKAEETPSETVWTVAITLTPDEATIAHNPQHTSPLVLLTNRLDPESWSDAGIVAEHRHQSIIESTRNCDGSMGLPRSVRSYSTPNRTRTLSLIFVPALMVRTWLQYTPRTSLQDNNETLPRPFAKKPVNNLTADIAREHFRAYYDHFARLANDQPRQRNALGLKESALQFFMCACDFPRNLLASVASETQPWLSSDFRNEGLYPALALQAVPQYRHAQAAT